VANAKWLNEAEMKAWLGFVTHASDLLRAIERDLEPFGVDGGDYQLLAMLSDAPDHRNEDVRSGGHSATFARRAHSPNGRSGYCEVC